MGHTKPNSTAQPIMVAFEFSNEIIPWSGEHRTLLELAEAHGIPINFGCKYGDCGACLTDLLAGEVGYLHQTGIVAEPGTCLPCSCRPRTSVTLRA